FKPICTETGFPPTSIVVFPLRYQPSDPVENSLTSAWSGTLPIVTVTGFAACRKSARVMGQVVFFAMIFLLEWSGRAGAAAIRPGIIPCPRGEAASPVAILAASSRRSRESPDRRAWYNDRGDYRVFPGKA